MDKKQKEINRQRGYRLWSEGMCQEHKGGKIGAAYVAYSEARDLAVTKADKKFYENAMKRAKKKMGIK